jgi:hypothetical protein
MRAHSLYPQEQFRLRMTFPKTGTHFFGVMRLPKTNVPPRRAALFAVYSNALRFSTEALFWRITLSDNRIPLFGMMRSRLTFAATADSNG